MRFQLSAKVNAGFADLQDFVLVFEAPTWDDAKATGQQLIAQLGVSHQTSNQIVYASKQEHTIKADSWLKLETGKYNLNETEAALIHARVASYCATLKNWISTAVEAGDTKRAQELVKELRVYEALFAKTNVEAHKFVETLAR